MPDPITLEVPVDSLLYVRVPVVATDAAGTLDPTADAAEMAVVPVRATPDSGDWKAAVWDTDGETYELCVLVGPAGEVELTPGDYRVWVRVHDTPEAPVMRSPSIVRAF